MSVAGQFGLDGRDAQDSPLLVEAREGWARWCAADPSLAVVEDLADLPGWIRAADLDDRSELMRRIAAMTASDRSAVAALVWLLVPGACRTAHVLQDLSPDIDALVASELWVQAAQAHRLTTPWIARAVLGETRREVEASLGVGRRADRMWRRLILTDSVDLSASVVDDVLDPMAESHDLFGRALRDGVVRPVEVALLWEVATAAEEVGAPLRRGRAGLTTPAVADRVAQKRSVSARTVRRRVSAILDRLVEYAAAHVREDDRCWESGHGHLSA